MIFFRKKSLKHFRVARSRREVIEPEEVIIDRAAASFAGEDGDYFRGKFEVPVASAAFWITLLIVGGVLSFLLFRVGQLQFSQGDYFAGLLSRNYTRSLPIQSFRGVIYDRNFARIAENVPAFSLIFDRREAGEDAKKIAEYLARVSALIGVSEEDLKTHLAESEEFARVILVSSLSPEQVLALAPHVDAMPGFSIEQKFFRRYTEGNAMSHVTGYVGRVSREDIEKFGDEYAAIDFIGKSGLELQYEDILRGELGVKIREYDARGLLRKERVEKEAAPGKSLLLFLDSGLQKFSREALREKLRERGLAKGVVLALDPRTGGVRALVSLPDFDPNVFVSGLSQKEYADTFLNKNSPFFNRAVSGLYPPGSTIKPMIAAAALQERIIDSSKKLYAPEAIRVSHPYRKDVVYIFSDWKYHGWLSIVGAIAESSNTFFYQIGGGFKDQKGLGIVRIKEYLKKFGWGNTLGIDLPGEKTGLLPDPAWKEAAKGEVWYIGDTYNASIGQGDILATPLQVAAATMAVSNGGILYKPQIVDKIVNERREIVEDIPPVILRKDFIDPSVLEIVKKGMHEVTQPGGTATLLSRLPVNVGAKTGTAQPGKVSVPHSWISVFAPYENPEIVLVVLIENGGKGTSSPATQVAYKILDWYFNQSSNQAIKQ